MKQTLQSNMGGVSSTSAPVRSQEDQKLATIVFDYKAHLSPLMRLLRHWSGIVILALIASVALLLTWVSEATRQLTFMHASQLEGFAHELKSEHRPDLTNATIMVHIDILRIIKNVFDDQGNLGWLADQSPEGRSLSLLEERVISNLSRGIVNDALPEQVSGLLSDNADTILRETAHLTQAAHFQRLRFRPIAGKAIETAEEMRVKFIGTLGKLRRNQEIQSTFILAEEACKDSRTACIFLTPVLADYLVVHGAEPAHELSAALLDFRNLLLSGINSLELAKMQSEANLLRQYVKNVEARSYSFDRALKFIVPDQMVSR